MSEMDPRLSSLGPEARARVEAALKAAVEQELTAESPLVAARGEFSRGIIFSRSRPAALREEMESVIKQATELDEPTFAKFAERLRALKEAGGGQ
jgi:hypothetical protein